MGKTVIKLGDIEIKKKNSPTLKTYFNKNDRY